MAGGSMGTASEVIMAVLTPARSSPEGPVPPRPPAQATPAGLAAIIRGHWMIEDRLHWVRDMDFDEDRSQIRTAGGPRVMATLRNLAITILRLARHARIAAGLRYQARRPDRPLRTIMNC